MTVMVPSRAAGLLALITGLSAAAESAAHIDLSAPVPREQGRSREPNADLKQGPCGQVTDGRTDKVNVFAPGQTIEVVWAETTNHPSYYRIAFDREGDDDLPIFSGSGIGAASIDPSGICPVDGQVILAYDMDDRAGGTHTAQVTLPNVECESCTLQVVQFMYDTIRPYYFQCADIALRKPGVADAGALLDGGADASAAPPVLADVSAPPGCWSHMGPDAGRASPPVTGSENAPLPRPIGDTPVPAMPAPGPTMPAAAARHSGGGCSSTGARSHTPSGQLTLALALGVAWLRTRRRMDRRSGSASATHCG
jgi:hypothetical protein